MPGDRHVPLRDGAAARSRRPRPSRKLTLPLVICLASQLARRVPATMRACFQTISGGGPALPRTGRALATGWCLGLSLSAAQDASGCRLVPGAVNQRGGRGPGVMRKSGGPASVVVVEDGWPWRFRWVSLFGPCFAAVSGPGGPARGALNNGSIDAAGPAPPSERVNVAAAELAPRPWSCPRPVQVRLSGTGRGSGGCALSSGCLRSRGWRGP